MGRKNGHQQRKERSHTRYLGSGETNIEMSKTHRKLWLRECKKDPLFKQQKTLEVADMEGYPSYPPEEGYIYTIPLSQIHPKFSGIRINYDNEKDRAFAFEIYMEYNEGINHRKEWDDVRAEVFKYEREEVERLHKTDNQTFKKWLSYCYQFIVFNTYILNKPLQMNKSPTPIEYDLS